MKLSQWESIGPAVASVASSFAPDPGSSATMPTVSPPITVSPAQQQAFTPQVSPVFQQTQSSPGAVMTASPTQSARTGQEARSSGPVTHGAGLPSAGYIPRLPFGPSPALPESFPDPYAQPVFQDIDDTGMNDLIKTGLWGVGLIGAYMLLGNGKKGKRKTSKSKTLAVR